MPMSARGSNVVCQPASSSRHAELDVLGGHPAVVTADGQHRVAAKEPEHACDDADPPAERPGAPDQADDRCGLEGLQVRARSRRGW